MRRTIHKVFFVWDYEKEEAWLNEMSAEGLQLIGVGFCRYEFEETNVNQYTYKLELLKNLPSHATSSDYIHFLEDTGIQHVGSHMSWVYLRKKVEDGAFDLYSDIDSRIKHYKRIINLFLWITALNFSIMLLNLFISIGIGSPFNFVCSILAFLITLFLGLGLVKITAKVNLLKREKAIRE